jgi:hypothetical protein
VLRLFEMGTFSLPDFRRDIFERRTDLRLILRSQSSIRTQTVNESFNETSSQISECVASFASYPKSVRASRNLTSTEFDIGNLKRPGLTKQNFSFVEKEALKMFARTTRVSLEVARFSSRIRRSTAYLEGCCLSFVIRPAIKFRI